MNAGRFSRLLILLLLVVPMISAPAAIKWQEGRLIGLELNGQGSSLPNTPKIKRNDVWWTYGICTAERTYYAVSRVNPGRIGLAMDSPVKFYTGSNQITLDSKGVRYVLRIVRENKSAGCTSR